jgi:hypothetical protein
MPKDITTMISLTQSAIYERDTTVLKFLLQQCEAEILEAIVNSTITEETLDKHHSKGPQDLSQETKNSFKDQWPVLFWVAMLVRSAGKSTHFIEMLIEYGARSDISVPLPLFERIVSKQYPHGEKTLLETALPLYRPIAEDIIINKITLLEYLAIQQAWKTLYIVLKHINRDQILADSPYSTMLMANSPFLLQLLMQLINLLTPPTETQNQASIQQFQNNMYRGNGECLWDILCLLLKQSYISPEVLVQHLCATGNFILLKRVEEKLTEIPMASINAAAVSEHLIIQKFLEQRLLERAEKKSEQALPGDKVDVSTKILNEKDFIELFTLALDNKKKISDLNGFLQNEPEALQLVNNYYRINDREYTLPLSRAVNAGNVGVVWLLMDHSANPFQQAKIGMQGTVIENAAQNANTDIMQKLLKLDAASSSQSPSLRNSLFSMFGNKDKLNKPQGEADECQLVEVNSGDKGKLEQYRKEKILANVIYLITSRLRHVPLAEVGPWLLIIEAVLKQYPQLLFVQTRKFSHFLAKQITQEHSGFEKELIQIILKVLQVSSFNLTSPDSQGFFSALYQKWVYLVAATCRQDGVSGKPIDWERVHGELNLVATPFSHLLNNTKFVFNNFGQSLLQSISSSLCQAIFPVRSSVSPITKKDCQYAIKCFELCFLEDVPLPDDIAGKLINEFVKRYIDEKYQQGDDAPWYNQFIERNLLLLMKHHPYEVLAQFDAELQQGELHNFYWQNINWVLVMMKLHNVKPSLSASDQQLMDKLWAAATTQDVPSNIIDNLLAYGSKPIQQEDIDAASQASSCSSSVSPRR